MDNADYYNEYWRKRGGASTDPIHSSLPQFLRRFTAYGAILYQIPTASRILDLGCGDGNVSRIYASKGTVTGMDISKQAIRMAKKRGINALYHDLNRIPYPLRSATFDVIVLTDVLEHLIDPVSTLKECGRLLTKSGIVIVTVPNFARLGNRVRMVFGDPVDILHFEKYGDEVEHLHWFTKPKLQYLARASGFGQTSFVPTGLQSLGFLWGITGLPQLGKFLTAVLRKS